MPTPQELICKKCRHQKTEHNRNGCGAWLKVNGRIDGTECSCRIVFADTTAFIVGVPKIG